MRLRSLALLALGSLSFYAACTSNDASKPAQTGGQAASAGGRKNSAGAKSSAGESSERGGEAGELALAGANGAGQPADGAGGERAAGGNGGAGGEDPASGVELPAVCPGVLADYVTLMGTDADDVFDAARLASKKLIFGLAGADTFAADAGGEDCLLGGPGNDSFSSPGEHASYYLGGPGADTYHVDKTGNYLRIADFEGIDRISLAQATFGFLTGKAGEVPGSAQVLVVAGYSNDTDLGMDGTRLVYDPDSGELWQDEPGRMNDQRILTILNHDGFVFDLDVLLLE
jgi:hypothetical protein